MGTAGNIIVSFFGGAAWTTVVAVVAFFAGRAYERKHGK